MVKIIDNVAWNIYRNLKNTHNFKKIVEVQTNIVEFKGLPKKLSLGVVVTAWECNGNLS